MQIYPLNACELDWEENLFNFYINSFQNLNTYERNFNLIINDSRLFNSNTRIGNYVVVKACSQKFHLDV